MNQNDPTTIEQFLSLLDEPVEETPLEQEVNQRLAEQWANNQSETSVPMTPDDNLLPKLFKRLADGYVLQKLLESSEGLLGQVMIELTTIMNEKSKSGNLDKIIKRDLMDELELRIPPSVFGSHGPLMFYEAAAIAIERASLEVAVAAKDVPRSADETVAFSAPIESTMFMAERDPKVMMARRSALEALRDVDELSARIYELSYFAARRMDEIGVLLGLPVGEVKQKLLLATMEVTLGE